MQQIQHWPDTEEPAKIKLSEEVIQDLHQQLILPFSSEDEAKEFWNEEHCTLIILDPTDDIQDLKQSDS